MTLKAAKITEVFVLPDNVAFVTFVSIFAIITLLMAGDLIHFIQILSLVILLVSMIKELVLPLK